ncbi:NACHT domain-containing protein [Fusarium falciforme]|uniref:NACHT domain-containing protein n=1 Tax=Fusarium falciforme TaxID=195108 RepID=UPI0023013F4F|nr:NACHT domain-containing protein [Fusarium falciforme]WAO93267.1 NACHT domain-containing protein [Fusarium falciforme]
MKDLSSAVGFAAKLKPEIRLAQAISEFNASLSNKNQRARFKNLQSQSPPSPDDIIRLTEEINRDGARAHRSWRPYGTRLVAILERMRQFAPIGDVLVGGSQNLIACGVWAVVRLSLETSLSFLSYFENVTNMMLRLGQSLSLHKDFAMLFPRCSTLQSYMCEYTIVMVNIYKKIVHDCAKSALSQLAASFTSTFDAVFKPLESDLTTWAQLIEKRATILFAKADLQSHSSLLERFNRLQVTMSRESAIQQKDTRKHQLLTSLCPNQGEFNLIWRRERKRGTSSWMYETAAYKSWLSSKAESVLWLKGNLGSGKTVTMAAAVAHLTLTAPSMDPQGAVTVSYFFCQSGNPKTLSASTLLGSIVGQALQNPALEPSLMSFLKQLETVPYAHAMPEEYIDILLKATPSNWRGIFVLDGLDEMPQEEVDDIFGQLHHLREHRWMEDICPRYTQELRSDAEILDILGNLPKDLPGAFEKALSRMRDGKYGSKLFKLVASAEPPLSMDELRVASNVEPGNTTWDNSTLSRSGKALISAYGGSLLDIDEEDFRVRFIHYSVLLHLTTPSSDVKTHAFHFDLEEAERALGAVCVTYLNYSVFENRVSTAQKVSFGQVPHATAGSVMSSEASRKAFSLLAKHKRRRDPKVDLERLSYKLQSEKWRVRDDVHLFLDYARNKFIALGLGVRGSGLGP